MIPTSWPGGASAGAQHRYRLVELDGGGFELQVRGVAEPDSAYRVIARSAPGEPASLSLDLAGHRKAWALAEWMIREQGAVDAAVEAARQMIELRRRGAA